MTSKADERKALEKIRKIVEELGADSYLAMAFEGCFEVAEENIENDFGCSLYQRAEAADRRVEQVERENLKLHAALRDAQAKAEISHRQIEDLMRNNKEREEDVDRWRQHSLEQGAEINRLGDLRDNLMNKEREMTLEIIKLKAKLFDLMCTEETA